MQQRTSIHLLFCMALAFSAPAVKAQCDTVAQGEKSMLRLKSEIAANNKKTIDKITAVMKQFHAKANKLGWDAKRKQAFLEGIRQEAEFAQYEHEKETQLAKLAEISEQMKTETGVPLKMCATGMTMRPVALEIDKLHGAQARYLQARFVTVK